MDLRNEVRDLLENKINELFVAFQEKLGITDGDIDPWQANRLDEQVDEMAENITSILHWEQDGQSWMGEEVDDDFDIDDELDEDDIKCIAEYEQSKKDGTLVTRPIEKLWQELGI